MRLLIYLTCSLLVAACGSDDSNNTIPPPSESCSVQELESLIGETLSQISSDLAFSFSVEHKNGRRYTFDRGDSSLQTSYQSASTSKLVSAVIIFRLVELGYLSLSDQPQDYISNWPSASTSSIGEINLVQLLSFTSGLNTEPLCINIATFDFETCVENIALRNIDSNTVPGESFYYTSTHLQVAGMMAYKAFGGTGWQDVFSDFQIQTGLFPTAAYELPSANNPRLAGGMRWIGDEYLDFLSALMKGDILNDESIDMLLTDHTADTMITFSPARESLMEDWHYGFGLWHECESSIFDCDAASRVSSPGAFGAYPYWDQKLDYVGLIAMQGPLGTFANGIMLERAVRDDVERWAECE